jgi:DNA polymerase III psi subunit
MFNQLTNNPEALRLFFTEDIFLVKEPESLLVTGQKGPELPLANNAETGIRSETKDPSASSAAAVNTNDITGIQRENQPTTSVSEVNTVENIGLQRENQETTSTTVIDFKYIGANERNILILVNDALYPVSSLQGRELLGKILKAIKLDRNDCALVNYATYDGASFQELQEFFNPQYVFAFGVSPEQLKLPVLSSNTIVVQNGANLIFSSNLDNLSEDTNTKKLLWVSLQQIKLR